MLNNIHRRRKMLEYKTLKCEPDGVDTLCQGMQVWGWKVEQTQEVYNENTEIISNETRLVGREDIFGNYHDVHYESNPITRTNVTHYVSIRFSRDKNMPNYDRIKALEEEYYYPKEKSPYVEIRKPGSGLPAVFGVFGALMFVWVYALIGSLTSGLRLFQIMVIVALFVVLAIFIPIIVVVKKKHKEKMQVYLQEQQKNEEAVMQYEKRIDDRRTEILEEVVTLLPILKESQNDES